MSKTLTLFTSPEGERRYHEAYDQAMSLWPVAYQIHDVPTRFGLTRVTTCGPIDAPPLILLHGMTTSTTMWYPNIEALAERFRVYAVDTLGDFGRSTITRPLKREGEGVAWLHEVMDGLDLPKARFAGLSMGAWLAINFTLRAMHRVERLVILAPAGALQPVRLSFFVKAYLAMLAPSAKRVGRLCAWLTASKSEALFDPRFLAQMVAGFRHARPLLMIMPRVFKDQELRGLLVPTQVLIGQQEVVSRAERALARAVRLIPGVDARMIGRASHCLTLEQAELVNQSMVEFLSHAPSPV